MLAVAASARVAALCLLEIFLQRAPRKRAVVQSIDKVRLNEGEIGASVRRFEGLEEELTLRVVNLDLGSASSL